MSDGATITEAWRLRSLQAAAALPYRVAAPDAAQSPIATAAKRCLADAEVRRQLRELRAAAQNSQ